MTKIVLGSFTRLDLYSLSADGKLLKESELSPISCLFCQRRRSDALVYAFYSAANQLTIVTCLRDGTESQRCITLREAPQGIYLSPLCHFITIAYQKSFDVLELESQRYIVENIATTKSRIIGQFSPNEHQFAYQKETAICLLNLDTNEVVVAYELKNFRQVTLGFVGDNLIIAAPCFDAQDTGFVKVFDCDQQLLNQRYQKADSFELRISAFQRWFLAIAKCDVDENQQTYQYYGTKQLHFFDVRARKVLNFSTAGQQVHSIAVQVLNEELKQELLLYIVEKVPTQLKLAIIATQSNVCTLKQLALGHTTKINSVSSAASGLILRGEGGMDGFCYSCRVNPQGQSFAGAIRIIGKEKILYKTHVRFAGPLILMGTLAPRLNVDNGVWVYDAHLHELSSLPYEKLMQMEVLDSFDTPTISLTSQEDIEGAALSFDRADEKPAAGSVYVPPGQRRKVQGGQAPKSQSFSLFQ